MRKNWVLGAILFISLALNFVLAGWVIGSNSEQMPERRFKQFAHKIQQLPEPTRSEVRDIVQQYRPQIRDNMNEVKDRREEIAKLVSGAEYSREIAEKQFEDLRKKTNETQTLAHKMILEIAEKLTPEQRKKFLNRNKKL